jgi:hypothetical protein
MAIIHCVSDPDSLPLDEMPDLLQSEVVAGPILSGAQTECEVIEATNPVPA